MVTAVKNFNRGLVKRTTNQQKKHFTQMSYVELDMMAYYLKKVRKLDKTPHLKEKIENKEVLLNTKFVYETLQSNSIINNIIEYNETYVHHNERIEQRVLVRLSKPRLVQIKGRGRVLCNTFVVINLTDKTIITSYFNEVTDTHNSLDMARYKNKLKVRPIARGGLPLSKWQNV